MRQGEKRDRARQLRRDMTDAERRLWSCLRMRQLAGYRFRRQFPVGPYIADFACPQASLLLEVDGGQHCGSSGDAARDAFLRARGFRVLRFWNDEVVRNPAGVCDVILRWLTARPPPQPSTREGRNAPQAGEGAGGGRMEGGWLAAWGGLASCCAWGWTVASAPTPTLPAGGGGRCGGARSR